MFFPMNLLQFSSWRQYLGLCDVDQLDDNEQQTWKDVDESDVLV
jgi:hypothetical protein